MKSIVTAVVLSLLSSSALAELQLVNGYVREMAPGQSTGAAFLTLKNSSDVAVELTGAASDRSQSVEFHQHHHHHGMMSMQPVASISIAAGELFVFEPGDHHLMLLGVEKRLLEGQIVNLSIELSDGSNFSVELPVERR